VRLSKNDIKLKNEQIKLDAKIALDIAMGFTIKNKTDHASAANKVAVELLKTLINENKSETNR
jgi:hypothetical protein